MRVRREQTLAALALAGIVGWAIWSYTTGGVLAALFSTELDSEAKVAAVRGVFLAWGPLAPLAYVLVCTVEVVVAPIPGTILYLPGGVIFGGFWGGTLSLLGNSLGSAIAFLLMRTMVGQAWGHSFFESHHMLRVEEFIRRRGLVSVVLLRVNPLTSSDIVSYAAGLTPMSLGTLVLGSTIGMAPLCYLQAYLSLELFTAFPWLLWPLIAGCGLYVVLAVVAIRKLRLDPNGIESHGDQTAPNR